MKSPASILVLLLALDARAGIVDRIVVTVGNQVITQSEIVRQTRIAAFLNGTPVDMSASSRRKTAERIIEQALIRKEAQVSQYPPPEKWEAEKIEKEAREARSMSEQEWQFELNRYGITEAELVKHFELQLQAIRFTDYRFRPAVQITEGDIRDYHAQKYKGKPAPQYEDAREALERELIDKRVDEALDRWLKEARMQTRIEIREDSFK